MKSENSKRDDALDMLEHYRKHLIAEGKRIALQLVQEQGTVTAPQVLRELKAQNVPGVNEVDARFMGAVFREGWERVSFVPQGSHNQPISLWKRRKE